MQKVLCVVCIVLLSNVSNRAIEETAGMILEYVQKNKDRR